MSRGWALDTALLKPKPTYLVFYHALLSLTLDFLLVLWRILNELHSIYKGQRTHLPTWTLTKLTKKKVCIRRDNEGDFFETG